MPNDDARIIHRTARLLALAAAQETGWLEGHTLQEISDALALGNDRATILRDLRDLPEILDLRDRLIARLRYLATDL